MSKEIERKFLVRGTAYREAASCCHDIQQCYLSVNPDSTVRLRTRDNDAFLTIKSRNHGATRGEWEYSIPKADALEMLATCTVSPVIEKRRYRCGRWEVDEFFGRLRGLVVAEIELSAENESFDKPEWIGREVTDDKRYFNSILATSTELPPME